MNFEKEFEESKKILEEHQKQFEDAMYGGMGKVIIQKMEEMRKQAEEGDKKLNDCRNFIERQSNFNQVRYMSERDDFEIEYKQAMIKLARNIPEQPRSIPAPDVAASKSDIPAEMPKYIRFLIDKGFIRPDGKTVAKSLDETAEALRDLGTPFAWNFLQDMFLKKDGTRYGKRACIKAVNHANTAYRDKQVEPVPAEGVHLHSLLSRRPS